LLLKSDVIYSRILKAGDIATKDIELLHQSDPLALHPVPSNSADSSKGSVSIDLRLGRWFLTLKHARHEIIDVVDEFSSHASMISNRHFVPFGGRFVLHPGKFVLGATLEWIRLPSNLGGYVSGKSSWGRRGLIIETAMGIHPGFSGCITLEIANVGEIPIALRPGMQICQCYFHDTVGGDNQKAQSVHAGFRRPTVGRLEKDFLPPESNPNQGFGLASSGGSRLASTS
jgi:dCTP deaminase